MPDPLSLEERTRRIVRRLQALQQFLDWTEEHDNPGAARAGFYEGLSDILRDVTDDAEFVRRAPFPLSEWQGETWEDFLAEYDQTYDESDLPDDQPDEYDES